MPISKFQEHIQKNVESYSNLAIPTLNSESIPNTSHGDDQTRPKRGRRRIHLDQSSIIPSKPGTKSKRQRIDKKYSK